MIFLRLFLSMFQIGLMSIGGGYAAVPLIQRQIVDLHGWLTMAEFTDVITIAEMTPGPIAINAATFVGIRVAGVPGALVATLGNVLPSCLIVLALARLYARFRSLSAIRDILAVLRPAVVAMIASAGLSLLLASFFPAGIPLQNPDFAAVAVFAVCFLLLRRKKAAPLQVMFGAGAAGLIIWGLMGL